VRCSFEPLSPAEDEHRRRDGRQHTDRHQRPADALARVVAELVGEQRATPAPSMARVPTTIPSSGKRSSVTIMALSWRWLGRSS
jgi:hypothetical protein